MKDNDTPSLPTKRSWLEAYGSALGLSLAIVIVITVIFLSAPTGVPKTPATPVVDEKDYYAQKTEETDRIIREAIEKSGGDWNKIPPAGQQRIQELSQGHGKEMLAMYIARAKEQKATKGKGAP
jgi:hypothetical protein